MKRKILLLTALIVCILMGWVLGYLRIPHLEQNYSFWLGFLACLGLFLFIIIFRIIWNKNTSLIRWISNNQTTNDSKSAAKNYLFIWTALALFIIIGGGAGSFMLQRQNRLFKNQSRIQDKRIGELSEMTASIRKSNQVFLMSHVLDKVDDELKNNPNGKLSDATTARVAALSYSFKPYRYFEGDSLSENKLSPERGQLLLALILMNMDTASFAQIKRSTTFAMADLREADLKGANLSGIDLKGANLAYADLSGANLIGADLSKSNLHGTKLNSANLRTANLTRADLGWAELNGANLNKATLNGANLESAQMRKADLRESMIQYAFLAGAMLNEANLTGSDLARSDLMRANLTNTDFTHARLPLTQLNGTTMIGAKFIHVEVLGDWLEELGHLKITGAQEILENYYIATDSSMPDRGLIYYLEKSER